MIHDILPKVVIKKPHQLYHLLEDKNYIEVKTGQ